MEPGGTVGPAGHVPPLPHRLFPLREPGVNWHAKPLTLREVEVSCQGGGVGQAGGAGHPEAPKRCLGPGWWLRADTFQAFKSCPEVKERLVRAYELMLDFYGIQLQDRATGAVCRAQHYQKRFQNLNW